MANFGNRFYADSSGNDLIIRMDIWAFEWYYHPDIIEDGSWNNDGKVYEVYYFKAEDGYDSSMVPVPGGHDYTISGTNTGGFIVTVDTGKTGSTPAAADPDEAAGEEAPENNEDTGENAAG